MHTIETIFVDKEKSFNCFEMMISKFEKARQVCLEGYFISFQKNLKLSQQYILSMLFFWHGGNMNTQQLLRHWNSKRSLRSRDKVIRLIWPVLKEQAQLFVNDNNQQSEDTLIQQFCHII